MKNSVNHAPLFGDIAPPAKRPNYREQRQKQIKRAFEGADAAFREQFRAFVLEFAERNAEFIIEDVSFEYKTRKDLVQPRDFRASGHIVQKLIREGLLRETGRYRKSVVRSSPMMVYSKGAK